MNNATAEHNKDGSRKGTGSADTKDLPTPLCEAKWHRVFTKNATLNEALQCARAVAAELTQQLASVQEASGQDGESESPSQNFQSRIFQGIAYTTSGAKAIVQIDGTSVGSPEATSSLESGTASDDHNATTAVGGVNSPLVDSSHERIPLETVYELRLWQVIALESSSECSQLGEVPNDTQSSGSANKHESAEVTNDSDASKSANVRDSNGGVLACEIRWLNGSGCAEVVVERLREGEKHDPTVREKAEDDGTNKDNGAKTLRQGCWCRKNKYLQHGADISGKEKLDETDIMRSVEVFVEEPEFGNTVFADELMSGRWRKKVGRKMIGTSAAAQRLATTGREN